MKYLYESDGVVKAYPKKKPKEPVLQTLPSPTIGDVLKMRAYKEALKKWEASGRVVDNKCFIKFGFEKYKCEDTGEIVWLNEVTRKQITPGQQVETEPSGENVIVTKIY